MELNLHGKISIADLYISQKYALHMYGNVTNPLILLLSQSFDLKYGGKKNIDKQNTPAKSIARLIIPHN